MTDLQRIDRWLWFARFFKSRTLAAKLCAGNRVRVNRQIVTKPSASVKVGDVLTFPQGNRIRVARILDLGRRRGPAEEAQALYEDLTPADPPKACVPATPQRPPGAGRPTKRQRRDIDRLRQSEDS